MEPVSRLEKIFGSGAEAGGRKVQSAFRIDHKVLWARSSGTEVFGQALGEAIMSGPQVPESTV